MQEEDPDSATSTPPKPTLTLRQAYLAMFEFLRRYYQRGPSDEVGELLGSLSPLADGNSADPALLADWHVAASTVLSAEQSLGGYRNADFHLDPPER